MDVMGGSKISMAERYQHVPDELRRNIASQVGGLLWKAPNDDDGSAVALVPA
jgi:integrase